MFRKPFLFVSVLSLLLLAVNVSASPPPQKPPNEALMASAALGTAFTYQGQLKSGGDPVSANCSMAFRLYDAVSSGNLVGNPITTTIPISNGQFAVGLDFGAVFNGDARWLDICVKCPSDSIYTALTPRQPLNATPYALQAAQLVAFNPNNRGSSVGLNWYNDGSHDWPRIRYGGNGEGSGNGFLIQGAGDSTKMAITDSGNVGIGTSSPTARLHIAAGSGQRAIYLSGGATIISTSLSSKWNLPSTSSGNGTLSAITSNWDTGGGLGFIEGSNVSSPVAWMYAADDRNAFTVAAKGYSGTGQDMSTIDSYLTPLFQVRENGRVGIGTTNPQTSLDVNGSIRMGYDATLTQSSGKNILEDRSGYGDTLRIAYNGGSASFTSGVLIYGGQTTLGLAVKPNGRVGIGTSSPQQTLDVSGTVRSKVVQITGGSDLAEPFEIVGAENVKPGLVVAIDTEHSGQLRIADRTYDHTVAGCVSGANGVNPGLVMQQEGTVAGGQFPVALSGRVYCWADASYGPIQPGDLLTTSDTPGHLMVVGDYDRAHGAIVGKAMSGLEAGQGLILVLVALQ